MQSQPISEVQFSKFPGGACPQTPHRRQNKLFLPLRGDQTSFRFDKTRSNFGLDPRPKLYCVSVLHSTAYKCELISETRKALIARNKSVKFKIFEQFPATRQNITTMTP